MSAKIEKGVPPPTKRGKPLLPEAQLVEQMEVGDSMVVANEKIASACRARGKQLGYKITVRCLVAWQARQVPREIAESQEQRYRIWRIA